MNLDHMEGLWKEISVQPPGRILVVTLQAALKAYGEERLVKDKGAGYVVGLVPSARKIKMGAGK